MEKNYYAYTKTVQNTTYYFVKIFLAFPDLKDVPAVLESYGMHTNFNKACEIAGISEEAVKRQLFGEIKGIAQQAKVIDLKGSNYTNQKTVNS